MANTGDRPIQVGSHYHFFETNAALKFDREKARGMRLDIAAGTAVRFEPGPDPRRATRGAGRQAQSVYGFRGEGTGKLGALTWSRSHAAYADLFGPTTGDRVRLADTALIIEIEKDFTIYGEEVKFGGGKVIRDGMGQSQVTADGARTVITNAMIVDHWGIVKADVAIKEGMIAAIGKAGNPDIQPGVTIVIGPGTDIIAGEGKILTAGGFDTHIHFIARSRSSTPCAGVTTMLGGGTGPSHGTLATTCTPGPWYIGADDPVVDAFPSISAYRARAMPRAPQRWSK